MSKPPRNEPGAAGPSTHVKRALQDTTDLLLRDQQFCWHPFTQAATALPPLPIVKGAGAYLYSDTGQAYIDAVSSWWVNIHGHCHPAIAKAIGQQALQLEQAMFAGITHPPAVNLSQALADRAPGQLQHVFFTDNGSTAIEVALKMACQYWSNQGQSRRRFLAMRGGYHGDTFGAMSTGRSSGFYTPFEPWLFKTDFLPYPDTAHGEDPSQAERDSLHCLDRYLQTHAADTAALIIEPLVQGASGMRMVRTEFIRALTVRCQSMGIPVIFDEVMTGFARTGTLFAADQLSTPEHRGLAPDILCLSKGLTGGFLPMGATIATPAIYQAFLSQDVNKALLHGHSYTANPLGCAAALASLQLFDDQQVWNQIRTIEATHAMALEQLARHPAVQRTRQCGTIAAFEVKTSEGGYGSSISQWLRQALLREHILVRPLGNTLYVIPPYCISHSDLCRVYEAFERVLTQWVRQEAQPGNSELF